MIDMILLQVIVMVNDGWVRTQQLGVKDPFCQGRFPILSTANRTYPPLEPLKLSSFRESVVQPNMIHVMDIPLQLTFAR